MPARLLLGSLVDLVERNEVAITRLGESTFVIAAVSVVFP